MAKLQHEALKGKTFDEVLTILGKKFLGENAVLRDYEELKAGISYNYKVKFGDEDGDKEFMLKVDNPKVGMRAQNKNVSGDQRPDDERFNSIARFINAKVERRGLKAPAFLPVFGNDKEFCVIADDEGLPEEFRGLVVSMQPFSAKGKGVEHISSPSEARSLGDNLGRLHRPSPLSNPSPPLDPSRLSEYFPVPLQSPQVTDSIKRRTQLEEEFGKTKTDRLARYITKSEAVGSFMERLNNSPKEAEKKLYTEMLKYFPGNKCSPETLELVIETACASQPKQDLSIWQISHNDLHGGNMLVDGKDGVTLIDFDELGRAGVTEDLWQQIEPLLNIFNREEAIKNTIPKLPKQALLEELLCGYLAHNPYLSRSEFQAVEDLTIMNVAKFASGDLLEMVTLAKLEQPTGEKVENLTNHIRDGNWMPAFLADREKQKEEKDLLGATYDKVFTEISRGTIVESLTDRSTSAKAREHSAQYDLDKSWVTRQKEGGSKSSNGGAGR